MRRRTPLLLLCLAACATSAAPPPPESPAAVTAPAAPSSSASAAVVEAPEAPSPGQKLRDATLRTSVALDTVRSLVDEASPRLSGSAGGKAAIGWAQRAMEAAGLARVHAEPVKVPHWERGDESGELLAPHAHALSLAALGGSVGTPAAGLEAEVIEVGSLDALDKLDPKDVKGKIVFFHVIMERLNDGSGYGKAVRVRGSGAIAAAKLGAVGVVIRSIGTGVNRTPHTGAMRYDPKVPKIPAAALAIPDADLLHRLVAQGKPVRLKLKLGARTLPDADSANVIGEVPGSSLPDEVVLLGAHLDSWDLGQGAIDDGAGCAIILEAGRQIARQDPKPKRTVRIVFFANEENGLAGATAYAKAHAAEVPKHVIALEADFGAGRVVEVRYSGAEDKRPQFLTIAALLKPLGVTLSTEPAGGGADISPLQALGVPILDLRQDGTTYFDFHHTANDTVERIEKAEIDQAAAAFAAAAYAAADAPSAFGRLPEDKRDNHH
ncbi:MAG: M20/M25/M40 family metallo-hydrolase [Byssovorax sp.]